MGELRFSSISRSRRVTFALANEPFGDDEIDEI